MIDKETTMVGNGLSRNGRAIPPKRLDRTYKIFDTTSPALSGGKLDYCASGIDLHRKLVGEPFNIIVLLCVVYRNNHKDFAHLSRVRFVYMLAIRDKQREGKDNWSQL